MAVRVGFEPTEPFPVHFFSKEALSTTQPPNRNLLKFPQKSGVVAIFAGRKNASREGNRQEGIPGK